MKNESERPIMICYYFIAKPYDLFDLKRLTFLIALKKICYYFPIDATLQTQIYNYLLLLQYF